MLRLDLRLAVVPDADQRVVLVDRVVLGDAVDGRRRDETTRRTPRLERRAEERRRPPDVDGADRLARRLDREGGGGMDEDVGAADEPRGAAASRTSPRSSSTSRSSLVVVERLEVERPHRVTVVEETACEVQAEEAGAARDGHEAPPKVPAARVPPAPPWRPAERSRRRRRLAAGRRSPGPPRRAGSPPRRCSRRAGCGRRVPAPGRARGGAARTRWWIPPHASATATKGELDEQRPAVAHVSQSSDTAAAARSRRSSGRDEQATRPTAMREKRRNATRLLSRATGQTTTASVNTPPAQSIAETGGPNPRQARAPGRVRVGRLMPGQRVAPHEREGEQEGRPAAGRSVRAQATARTQQAP